MLVRSLEPRAPLIFDGEEGVFEGDLGVGEAAPLSLVGDLDLDLPFFPLGELGDFLLLLTGEGGVIGLS
jgi:hypothetical protein